MNLNDKLIIDALWSAEVVLDSFGLSTRWRLDRGEPPGLDQWFGAIRVGEATRPPERPRNQGRVGLEKGALRLQQIVCGKPKARQALAPHNNAVVVVRL